MAATSSGAPQARRQRWAISFADLLLLLLAFFVLLQANAGRRDAMLAGMSAQFGGRPMKAAVELRAADLFVPGDAVLTPVGIQRVTAAARSLGTGAGGLEIASHGSDTTQHRFDEWDLAAARLGAVARALKASGIPGDRLMIRGLDQADDATARGQVIRIAPGRIAAKSR